MDIKISKHIYIYICIYIYIYILRVPKTALSFVLFSFRPFPPKRSAWSPLEATKTVNKNVKGAWGKTRTNETVYKPMFLLHTYVHGPHY